MEKISNIKTIQTNLDLLRIIAMIMIIALHFLGHGGVLRNLQFFSGNYFIYWTIEGISFVAVNCYVLISGYFLIVSKFKLKKFFLLIAQVLFFSIMIYLILIITDLIEFSLINTIRAFTPILSGLYWFFTLFCILLLHILNYIINPHLILKN